MGINLAEEIQQRVTDYHIDNEHDPSEENMEALLEGASLKPENHRILTIFQTPWSP